MRAANPFLIFPNCSAATQAGMNQPSAGEQNHSKTEYPPGPADSINIALGKKAAMNEDVIAKYGQPTVVKYLVNNLDDLKDVIETVRQMISRGCHKDDVPVMEKAIGLDTIPLKNTLSSFIISLEIPSKLLQTAKGGRSRPDIPKAEPAAQGMATTSNLLDQ